MRRQASLYFVLLRPKNCSVEKLTATLNRFNKCYEWNVRENFLFNSDSSSSVPLLSLRNVVSSPFTFFLRLLQPKGQHCVPNFAIFLTAYYNYVAKVVTRIWRRLNFAGLIFCPSRHMSCSIQSYLSDQLSRLPFAISLKWSKFEPAVTWLISVFHVKLHIWLKHHWRYIFRLYFVNDLDQVVVVMNTT